MTSAREPAVAGTFYPADPQELNGLLADLLDAASACQQSLPKALIAPHAGYVYSGPVAASAYVNLAPLAEQITRVVLLGPAHRKAFRGMAVPVVNSFRTPLGPVPLDKVASRDILSLPHVHEDDAAHAQEHSLEVHLPFLQHQLHHFMLVPVVVGDASPTEVAAVIQQLWGGPETLLVISSDLSHYLDYETARARDAATSRAIESLAYEDIDYEDACGRNPVGGLLHYARERGLRIKNVDLRNSGDTAGPRDRVVGYGSYLLAEQYDL